MLNIVAFGEALVDMIPEYGPGGPGSRPQAFLPSPGGAPANIAVAAARLGCPAWFVGKVGQDLFGDMIRDALAGYGVHTEHLLRTPEAPTALAFVAHDAGGERSFSFYRNPSADLLYRAEEFPASAFADAGILHVCSNTLTDTGIRDTTQQVMEQAAASGFLVSLDVNYRDALWAEPAEAPEAIWRAVTRADVVKMSRDELEELYLQVGEAGVVEGLLAAGVRLVVITDGGRAISYFTRDDQGTLEPPDIRPVDTTAAGDAFVGGLLCRLSRAGVDRERLDDRLADSAGLRQDLAFAARCGALAASRYGAYESLPTADELDRT